MQNRNFQNASTISLMYGARRLFGNLSTKLKHKVVYLFAVTMFCSFLEALMVSIVSPMISLWINPTQNLSNLSLIAFFSIDGSAEADNLSIILTVIFICTVILGGGARILLIRMTAHLSSDAGAELAEVMFNKIIHQKFSYLSSRNSSELISLLNEKVIIVSSLLLSALTLMNAVLMVSFIWIGMALVNFSVVAVASLFFIVLYIVVIYLTRTKIDTNSVLISTQSPQFLKRLRETFGSIRDIKLSGTEAIYLKSFSTISRQLKRISAQNTVMSQAPRYIIETIGLTLVAVFAIGFGFDGKFSSAVPLLGALAIGGQRLMPLIQLLYSSYVNIRVSRYSLIDVIEITDLAEPELAGSYDRPAFDSAINIALENVCFAYRVADPPVVNGLSISIPAGARLALVGQSGAGKSTLLDIITGLLEPDRGVVKINGEPLNSGNLRFWRCQIAYVPQVIFIMDGSIAENIAFGIPKHEIDYVRMREVCEKVDLLALIESNPRGFETVVGERGSFLSGGQRQRLGLARALYQRPRVLILDEATNQLDSKTEASVLANLFSIETEVTIIHVTHRIEVARDYDFILEMVRDGVVNKGSYEDLSQESVSFRELIRSSNLSVS